MTDEEDAYPYFNASAPMLVARPADRREYGLAQWAWTHAFMRWTTARRDRRADDQYASLGELLWWTVALDEWFGIQSGNEKLYVERRDRHPNGRQIAAIRFARNRVGHGLTGLLEMTEGRDYPAELFPVGFELRWRAHAELPPGKRDIRGSRVYLQEFEGKPVRLAVERARYYLTSEAEYVAFGTRLNRSNPV